MAKEVKNKEVILTEENIVNELEKKNRMNTALNEQMLAEINKEKDERIKNEIKCRFLKATYQRDLALLQRRLAKKKAEIALYKIRQSGRILRFLTGFKVDASTLEYAKTKDDIIGIETLNEKDETITIIIDKKTNKKETYKVGDNVPAVIDVVDYDIYKEKLDKKIEEMTTEITEEHNNTVGKLDLAYGKYYVPSWRW